MQSKERRRVEEPEQQVGRRMSEKQRTGRGGEGKKGGVERPSSRAGGRPRGTEREVQPTSRISPRPPWQHPGQQCAQLQRGRGPRLCPP